MCVEKRANMLVCVWVKRSDRGQQGGTDRGGSWRGHLHDPWKYCLSHRLLLS